mmetsp:Transcript_16221/g.46324  ORF Transcript_16221/g.46324 Transcript_16221/m.46324 type:complete len:228 (-) Transcript_16221:18-701(-)
MWELATLAAQLLHLHANRPLWSSESPLTREPHCTIVFFSATSSPLISFWRLPVACSTASLALTASSLATGTFTRHFSLILKPREHFSDRLAPSSRPRDEMSKDAAMPQNAAKSWWPPSMALHRCLQGERHLTPWLLRVCPSLCGMPPLSCQSLKSFLQWGSPDESAASRAWPATDTDTYASSASRGCEARRQATTSAAERCWAMAFGWGGGGGWGGVRKGKRRWASV